MPMRILFLTPELPHPAASGGTIKSAAVLRYLKGRHTVDLMCLRRGELSPEQAAWTAEMGEVVTVGFHRERSAATLLRSYATRVPLSIERNRSATLARLVTDRLARGRYDAVYVDGWLMAQYLPDGFRGLRVLHEHNAEHVMWQRQAGFETNLVRREIVRKEAERVRRYEASLLRRFDVVFAVSEPDRRALLDLESRPTRVEVLSNVPDSALLDRAALSPSHAEPMLLYLATLSWQPNLHGLQLFLKDAFPRIRERLPGLRFIVAGRGATPGLAKLAARIRGVELIGDVGDPEPLYRRARAFVEVARGGSGTRLKVLNALARGLPVVTTPEGAEGLEIRPGRHALVGGTVAETVDAVVRVMTDDAAWTALAEHGRRLICERYVPEVAFTGLDDVFPSRPG